MRTNILLYFQEKLKRELELFNNGFVQQVAWPTIRTKVELAELLFSSPVSTFPDYLFDDDEETEPSRSKKRKLEKVDTSKLQPMAQELMTAAKEHMKSSFDILQWDNKSINNDL